MAWEDDFRVQLAARPWWRKINPIRWYHAPHLRLTVIQWCDASVTEKPMFKGKYHYIDWLIQNHGRFTGWPVGIQIWR